jgi:hypothetical protein
MTMEARRLERTKNLALRIDFINISPFLEMKLITGILSNLESAI